MVKNIILFLLISLPSYGQIPPGVTAVSARYSSNVKTYVYIPDAPTFSDTYTLIQGTVGNSVTLGETNGKTDLLLGSNWNLFQLNGLSGNYRLKSLDATGPDTWSVLGSSSPNDYSFSAAVSTPGLELYNVKLVDSDNIFKMPGANPTKNYVIQNVILQGSGFAGFLVNENVSGDDYGNWTYSFCRGKDIGAEFFYLGKTGTSVANYTGITSITNCYVDSCGREPLQFNNHEEIRVSNVTALNGGLATGDGIGQVNCFQAQGILTGYIRNCILFAHSPAMIASTGLRIQNNFIGWQNTAREIYMQDISANGYNYEQVGDTVFIEDNIFYCPGYTLDWVFRIQEENCHYVIRNNVFPAAATDIIKDERASTPYSITMSGNTFTDSPPLPTFGSSPDVLYQGWEKVVTDDYYYGRGMGYRTPPNYVEP
jgi:hypothetical protein